MIREGSVDVPGASLRYKLVGEKNDLPTIVFENGWAASYHYWAYVERELSPHAQLLFYNRAGIGGSTCTQTKTAQSVADQFEAMLVALKIQQPVVVVGQSYGGLMCALLGALKPQCVLGFVQLDNTPEQDDPFIRKTLALTKVVTRVTLLLNRLGLPDPIYGAASKALPPREGRLLLETAFGNPESMKHAFIELDMVNDFRAAITSAKEMPPRLTITAGAASERKGLLAKLIASEEKAKAIVTLMEKLHRQQAAKNGTWEMAPFGHGDLCFKEDGARYSAKRALEFTRSLR